MDCDELGEKSFNKNNLSDFEMQGRFDDSIAALPDQLYFKDWIAPDNNEVQLHQSTNQQQVEHSLNQNQKDEDKYDDDDDYYDAFDNDLHRIGLRIKRVEPDKNTFFRAVADQLWGDEDQHQIVRWRVCEFIQNNLKILAPYDEKYDILNSFQKIQNGRTGASRIKYWAVQLIYRVNICLYRYQKPRCLFQKYDDSGYNTIYISRHEKLQFNSVRKINDFAPGKPQKLKLNSIQIPKDVEKYLRKQTRSKIPDEILVEFENIEDDYKLKKPKIKVDKKQQINEKGIFRGQSYYQQNFLWNGYKRLHKELNKIGLRVKSIQGDGNCFFRAVGDQLCGDSADADEIRQIIMDYIEQNEEKFSNFMEDCSFQDYIKNKRQSGCWGGYIELQAASEIFQVNICIFEYGKPRRLLNNFPEDENPRTIYLAYTGMHYDSIRKIDDYGEGTPKKIHLEKFLDKIEKITDEEKLLQLQKDMEKVRQEVLQNRQQANQQQLKENRKGVVKALQKTGEKIVDSDQFKSVNVMMYLMGYVFSTKQMKQVSKFFPWIQQQDNRKNINGYMSQTSLKNSNNYTEQQKTTSEKKEQNSTFLEKAIEL